MLDRSPPVVQTAHPLAPPTVQEIETGAKLVKARLGERAGFCSVRLVEAEQAIHSKVQGRAAF